MSKLLDKRERPNEGIPIFLKLLPPELERLSLQKLYLFCERLSGDLSPLASLTSLQTRGVTVRDPAVFDRPRTV